MRKRIHDILETNVDDKIDSVYDVVMIVMIIASLIPLCTHTESGVFLVIDWVCFAVFALDYLARWATADYKLGKGAASFLLYPFTPMAIADMLSLLPTVLGLNESLRLLRVFRFIRALRIFRVFRVFRYSKNVAMLVETFRNQKQPLLAAVTLALGYIFITALLIFNVEPETFPTLFDALYWATVSLTTVGYGDIYAVSTLGKALTMVSALVGVAIVAIPAGIITAGYLRELNKSREKGAGEETSHEGAASQGEPGAVHEAKATAEPRTAE